MKIIYLYKEVHGFTISTVKKLINLGYEVHIITYDSNYNIPKIPKLYIYKRENYNFFSICYLIKKLEPKLICVSGWMDKTYLFNCIYSKFHDIIVVAHSDNTWNRSFKNYIASLLGFFNFFDLFFNYIWIHGPKQKEYVNKIGFKKKQIILDHASADLNLFHKAFKKNIKIKKKRYPKTFLFVGRLTKSKGIDLLLEAWDEVYLKTDWKLKIIGSGPFKIKSNKKKRIVCKKFLQPKKLLKEVKNSGCFILPSIFEPWGVVVHEFAAGGLPLLLSSSVGSAPVFLKKKINGYIFNNNSKKDLIKKLFLFSKLSKIQLINMSFNSYKISNKITPESSANNLVSVIKTK